MILITSDPGQVKVGDKILPGVFESLEITGGVQTDEVEIKGKKTKITQAVGYTNPQIRLSLVLIPEDEDGDCIEQIRTIQDLFRKSPAQETPGVYRIINKHVQARGINEVIFSELRTYEDNKNEKVIASLGFIEHTAVTVKIATSTSGSASGSSSSSSGSSTKNASSTAGFRALEQASIKKTDKTPAKDKKAPGFGTKLLSWLRGKDVG